MKSFMKKSLAVVVALMMLSCSFSCLAAVELDKDAVEAHYGQYENYLLLGDSAASGYRDEMSENDANFNKANNQSTYYRVPGSYADIIANSIIADKSMTSFAAPGYRTIEIRYMLEDDYAAACTDEFLFHPAQLYVYDYQPGEEKIRQAYKDAVAAADLITLGVGGNDWGAYILWVITDILENAGGFQNILADINDIIATAGLDLKTVNKVLDLLTENSDAFIEVATTLPSALEYGLSTFYENWDYMIEDIYAYNPDVTLMVVGMSDNGLKGKNYDYNGVEGAPVAGTIVGGSENDISKLVVDFIMTVGNTPMIEGAKKYGYTYVDTTGTTYVDSHPDADGHKHIANKIIEALPDRELSTKYDDVKPGHKYYGAIEYVLRNGLMTETSATTFSPDDAFTSGQLNMALNAIKGTDKATAGTSKVNVAKFAFAMLSAGTSNGIAGFAKGVSLFLKVVADHGFNVLETVTRGEAAYYFMNLCK